MLSPTSQRNFSANHLATQKQTKNPIKSGYFDAVTPIHEPGFPAYLSYDANLGGLILIPHWAEDLKPGMQKDGPLLDHFPLEPGQIKTTKVTNTVFIGNSECSQNFEFLSANKIKHVLNLCPRAIPDLYWSEGIEYRHMDWQHVLQGTATAQQQAQQGQPSSQQQQQQQHQQQQSSSSAQVQPGQEGQLFPRDENGRPLGPTADEVYQWLCETTGSGESSVLVTCEDGESLCTAVAVLYLIKRFGWKVDRCIDYIQSIRKTCVLADGIAAQLREMEGEGAKKRFSPPSSSSPVSALNGSTAMEETVLLNTRKNTMPRATIRPASSPFAFLKGVDGTVLSPLPPSSPDCALRWGEAEVFEHHEIGIEYARWFNPDDPTPVQEQFDRYVAEESVVDKEDGEEEEEDVEDVEEEEEECNSSNNMSSNNSNNMSAVVTAETASVSLLVSPMIAPVVPIMAPTPVREKEAAVAADVPAADAAPAPAPRSRSGSTATRLRPHLTGLARLNDSLMNRVLGKLPAASLKDMSLVSKRMCRLARALLPTPVPSVTLPLTGNADVDAAGYYDVAFGRDYFYTASASQVGAVVMWRLSDGKPERIFLQQHGQQPSDGQQQQQQQQQVEAPVLSVCCLGDAAFASGDLRGDITLRWMTMDKGKAKVASQLLRGHTKGVNAIAMDAQVVVSASFDGTVRVWGQGSTASTLTGVIQGDDARGVTTVRMVPHQNLPAFVTGSKDGIVRVWDATARAVRFRLAAPLSAAKPIRSLFVLGSESVIAGGDDAHLRVWSLRTKTVVEDAELQGSVVAIAANQAKVIAVVKDGTTGAISIFNQGGGISNHKPTKVVRHAYNVKALAINGSRLVSVSETDDSRSAVLWNLP